MIVLHAHREVVKACPKVLILGWCIWAGACEARVGSSLRDVFIFSANRGESEGIHLWMMSSDGDLATLQQLTMGPILDSNPAVSGDGRWLAFSRGTLGDPVIGHIWVRSLISGVETQVTNGLDGDSRPFWAPDGGVLGFTRQINRSPDQTEGGIGRIWMLPIERSGDHLAVGAPQQLGGGFGLSRVGGSWNPKTSADIVFANEVTGINPWAIWRASYPDGRESEVISHGCCGNRLPRYSPNGESIAFITEQHSEESDVYLIAPDGTRPTRVTCSSGWSAAVWSPDGHRLLLARSNSLPPALWVIDVPPLGGMCTEPRRITPEGFRAQGPTWARVAG